MFVKSWFERWQVGVLFLVDYVNINIDIAWQNFDFWVQLYFVLLRLNHINQQVVKPIANGWHEQRTTKQTNKQLKSDDSMYV